MHHLVRRSGRPSGSGPDRGRVRVLLNDTASRACRHGDPVPVVASASDNIYHSAIGEMCRFAEYIPSEGRRDHPWLDGWIPEHLVCIVRRSRVDSDDVGVEVSENWRGELPC